jgi:predicted O-linked N-acetylglucosamine transferase (SPINDLY family)
LGKAKFYDITADPRDSRAWTVRAAACWHKERFAEAAEACDRALSLDPNNAGAARLGIQCRLHICDWHKRDEDKRRLSEALRKGSFTVGTMDLNNLCGSEQELRLGAEREAANIPQFAEGLWRGERYRHDKIRIAYISSELRHHVVAACIVGCFEHHDKSRFETTAISLTPDDGSEYRRRIAAAFDRFEDASAMSDSQVAAMIRALEIDIAIDLNGYSGSIRSGIAARRPAPVQVNYLGYAGTMAAPYIDYIIADDVVIPEESRLHYSEQVAYLPNSYLPSDHRRPVAAQTPLRNEAGLPETGFVFTCRNATHKIGPEMFDLWMQLLRAVDGSVLWLQAARPAAEHNLRREAQMRNVAPERLVFTRRVQSAEAYLARLSLGDLFLDTLPFNAHATASDALWVGLPVLTCLGTSFPGRVGASLLNAVGLPELVTKSLSEYRDLALALASDPERLAGVKAKLLRNRQTHALFDTARFTRHLEAAYATMWERQQAGLPPAAFHVAG